MNTAALFKQISRRMQADFEASAQVRHAGSKGTVRENILRNFLAEGRLPGKYGLGSGEVVGRIRSTSNQCDLIIYDKLEGVALHYDENTQVYPIDCVYGIVEVKSALSKAELIDSLDKIATFKAIAPGDRVAIRLGGMTTSQIRSRPFGMVFAYSLSGNSLSSLEANLREWQKGRDPSTWPNYICVLSQGVIFHQTNGIWEKALSSEALNDTCWPIAIHHREDSLYEFYCTLHDLCAGMRLGPVELATFYQPHEGIGRFVVKGRVEFVRESDKQRVRFTQAFLEKVVAWCSEKGSMTYGDFFRKQLGQAPEGTERVPHLMARATYLYNPLGLPGLPELGGMPIKFNAQGQPEMSAPSLLNVWQGVIDDRFYIISLDATGSDDFEIMPD